MGARPVAQSAAGLVWAATLPGAGRAVGSSDSLWTAAARECAEASARCIHSVASSRIHSMSAVSIPSQDVRAGARLWRRLLVVAAVGQAVSSALVSVFGGAFTTADRAGEPLIVPPGGAFIIWNVIIALSIGYAIWAESD